MIKVIPYIISERVWCQQVFACFSKWLSNAFEHISVEDVPQFWHEHECNFHFINMLDVNRYYVLFLRAAAYTLLVVCAWVCWVLTNKQWQWVCFHSSRINSNLNGSSMRDFQIKIEYDHIIDNNWALFERKININCEIKIQWMGNCVENVK